MIGFNYSLFQLLAFSGLALLFFAICLFVGLCLFNLKLANLKKTYFLNSFLGFFVLVCIYSFIQASYKTINVLPFIALIYLFFKHRKKLEFKSIEWKELFPVLYIFPITFILYGCYNLPNSIENDVRFYARIVSELALFKQENVYHFYNNFRPDFNGVMPYHYTDMWFASLFNVLFGIKSIIALKYVSYPFLISSISYGVLGFIKGNSFFYFLLFLFLSSFPFYIVSIFKSGFVVYTDFWLRPNYIIYYYGLTSLFILFFERKWDFLFVIGAIISSIPDCFLCLYVYYTKRKLHLKKRFFLI